MPLACSDGGFFSARSPIDWFPGVHQAVCVSRLFVSWARISSSLESLDYSHVSGLLWTFVNNQSQPKARRTRGTGPATFDTVHSLPIYPSTPVCHSGHLVSRWKHLSPLHPP